MARENIFDIASNELKKRLDAGKSELQSRFKGTNPYRKEPIPKKELLQFYESLTPELMEALIKEQGAPAVNKFIEKMEKQKEVI